MGTAVTVHRSEVNGSDISNFGIRWSCVIKYTPGHSLRQGKETSFPIQKVRRSPEPIRTKWLKEMSPVSKEIELLPCRPSGHSLDIILINFDVLLTVHLSIILATDQLNAQILVF